MREKKEINIKIGEQIKLAREQVNLTQEQMAEKVDVSPQYVSDLERGVVGVSIATLKRICTVLHVSSDQILFARKSDSKFTAMTDLCQGLSDRHIMLLTEIVKKYVEAVESAQPQ